MLTASANGLSRSSQSASSALNSPASPLATALVLSFFAGEVIKPFALVMTFGIVVGTFSSVFVAAPVLLWITKRWRGAEATVGRPMEMSPTSVRARP